MNRVFDLETRTAAAITTDLFSDLFNHQDLRYHSGFNLSSGLRIVLCISILDMKLITKLYCMRLGFRKDQDASY